MPEVLDAPAVDQEQDVVPEEASAQTQNPFSDLIPKAKPMPKDLFSDLIPKSKPAKNQFSDLIPAQKKSEATLTATPKESMLSTIGGKVRKSLTPLIGPTEEQKYGESVLTQDEHGNLAPKYKPMGGKVEQEGLFPALSHPMVPIPKLEGTDPRLKAFLVGALNRPVSDREASVVAGLYNTGKGFGEFFESPLGIATAGAGTGPAALKKLVSGLFALDIGSKTPEAAQAFGKATVTGTPQEQVESGLNLATSVVLPGILSGHTIAKTPPAPPLATEAVKVAEAGAPATAQALAEVGQSVQAKTEPVIAPEPAPVPVPPPAPTPPSPTLTPATEAAAGTVARLRQAMQVKEAEAEPEGKQPALKIHDGIIVTDLAAKSHADLMDRYNVKPADITEQGYIEDGKFVPEKPAPAPVEEAKPETKPKPKEPDAIQPEAAQPVRPLRDQSGQGSEQVPVQSPIPKDDEGGGQAPEAGNKEDVAKGPRQGKVGDMLGSGEQVLTSSGRTTTPFPKVKTGPRSSGTTLRNVDAWLRDNAIAEAESRGDEYNARMFRNENPKNMPSATKDGMEEYLFGQQPEVPKPFLKEAKPTPPAPAPKLAEGVTGAEPRKNLIQIQREKMQAETDRAKRVEAEESARQTEEDKSAEPVIDALRKVSGQKHEQSGIATDRGGNIWSEVLDGKFTQEQLNAARHWLIRNHTSDTRLMRAVEGATAVLKEGGTGEETVPKDLQQEIENQKTGSGPLTDQERVELNELRIVKENRGKLGALNQARVDWLEQREKGSAPKPEGSRSAAADAEKAVQEWGKYSVEVVDPLKDQVRAAEKAATEMRMDAQLTLPETKAKNRLTKKAFFEKYGVADKDEANALFKSKNKEWQDKIDELSKAEEKLKELARLKDLTAKNWSRAVSREKESSPSQSEAKAIADKQQQGLFENKTHAEQAKIIADKLRDQFKTDTGGKVFTGPVKIINAAVEVAAKIIETGGKLADAVEAAIKYFRDNHTDESDRADFESKMRAWARTEQEAQPPEFVTSTKNAVMESEREARGQAIIENAAHADPEVAAAEVLKNDPAAGEKLVQQILDNPSTPVNDIQEATLLAHKVKLKEDINNEINRSFDTKLSDADRESARLRTAQLLDDQNRLDQATKHAGRTWSDVGRFRQQLVAQDYSVATVLQKARFAKGSELNESEIKSFTEQSKAWEAKEKEIAKQQAEREVKRQKEDAEQARKDAAAKVERDKYREKVARKSPKAASVVAYLDEAADAARKRIKERGLTFGSGPLHELPNIKDYAIIGASHLAKGVFKAAWRAKMALEFGKGIEPYLDKIYEESLKEKADAVTRLGRSDLKAERESISAGVKEAVEVGAEAPDVGRFARKLAENFIAEEVEKGRKPGDVKGEEIDKAVHDALKEAIPEITPVEARDAWTGYGKYRQPTSDPIKVRLQKASAEQQKLSTIERLEKGQPGAKTGFGRQESTDLTRRRQQRINELKKQLGIVATDPATQLRSALEAIKTRNKNRIADLIYENSTRKRIVREKKAAPSDAETIAQRTEIDRLKKENDDIFGPRELTDEQRLDRAISAAERSEQAANERLDRAKRGDFSKPEGKPIPASSKLDAIRKRAEAAREQVANLKELANPKKTPEQIALQTAKTRIKNSIADLKDRIARMDSGDVTAAEPKPRKKVTPDPELLRMQTERGRIRQELEKKLLKYELDKRSKLQRAADILVRIHREFVISTLSALLVKLPGYSLFRFAERPVHEVIAYGLSKLPGISKVAERAPSEVARSGKEIRAIAGDYVKAFTLGIRDAKDVFAKGDSDLKSQFDPTILDAPEFKTFFGRLHQMEKSPLIRFTFERSFRRRLEFAAEHGEDITDATVLQKHGALAYGDALNEALVNKNEVVKKVQRFVESFTEKSKVTGRESGFGKAAKFAFQMEVPVQHVPANYVAKTLEYVFGLEKGLYDTRQAFKRGIETLGDEEANQIMRQLTKGSIGTAAIATGFLLPQVFGGLWSPVRNKNQEIQPGEIQTPIGVVPRAATHNQFLNAAQFGATLRQISETKLRKKDEEPMGLSAGAQAAMWGLIDETPYARELSDYVKARDPRQSGSWLGQKVAGYAVPGLVSEAAKGLDKDEYGDPIQRKPEGILENIQANIPGLREQLPEKKKK